ncbi:hypothetical protein [Nocardia inohanensis]|uniref:hypothetical protein n=1 Tax=Nocardia inohanensis TaxID=209246 RepID=UPI0008338240|nr:hypothetical protein [Nocardia inohanensis]
MPATFRDPQIADGEKSAYAISIGDQRVNSEMVGVVTRDADDRYRSLLELTMPGDFTMTVEQTFDRAGETLTCRDYRAESRHGETLVSSEYGNFADTSHLQFGGAVAPFPNRMVPLLGGVIAFRGLEFTKGAKQNADLWLGFSVHWPVEVKVDKRVTLELPAGRFDAWQVRVRPSFAHINGLLDKVMGSVLPPFVLHYDAARGHRMLRFSFPTGPMPWNPKGLVELTGTE